MKDGFEDLKAFYVRCDQAEPPSDLRLPSNFAARLGWGWLRPLAPFFGGFAVATAFLSAAATSGTPGETGSVMFPEAAKSAGLTNVELQPPQVYWRGILMRDSWRA